MKKILIGTHNSGKFKEISYLLSKKIKKVSPIKLKIKSPKETGKTFASNANLKAKYFSKFTKLPVYTAKIKIIMILKIKINIIFMEN